MGANKSKITIDMQLRSGKTYEIESVRSDEVSSEDDEPIIDEPGTSAQLMVQSHGVPVNRKINVRRIVRQSAFGIWFIIRLIPTILGIIGGVYAVAEFFMEPEVHEFNVRLESKREWLFNFLRIADEEDQF